MANGLNPKQAAFVREYLIDHNGTQAAIRAGYSEATAGQKASDLLKIVKIAEAIAEGEAELAERAQISKDEIVAELRNMGFANMGDYVDFLDNGGAAIDWSNLTREQAAAIAEVTIDEYMEGKGDEARPVKRVKFKLHDKRSSLVEIAKLLGYTEPTKVDLMSGGEKLSVTLNLGGAAASNED